MVQISKMNFIYPVVLDRKLEMPLIMASTEGGMNIEDVAEKYT